MGTEGSLPWGKRQGLEAIKNAWKNATSSLYVFKAWYLIKHRYNFACSLLGQRWNTCLPGSVAVFFTSVRVHLSTRPYRVIPYVVEEALLNE
jgi:hypothetical protein